MNATGRVVGVVLVLVLVVVVVLVVVLVVLVVLVVVVGLVGLVLGGKCWQDLGKSHHWQRQLHWHWKSSELLRVALDEN